jgi:hypothetical protein
MRNHVIVAIVFQMCVAACVALPGTEDEEPAAADGGGSGGVEPAQPPAFCFALEGDIYRTSAKRCKEWASWSIPVACVDGKPPASECAPMHEELDRENHYCCCDPRHDPTCAVVP